MLHVHIFFVAPLSAGNVSETGTNEHQRRVAVRKTTDNPCTSADLPVQPFDDVVRPNPRPVLRWEFAVSQCLINAVFNLLRRLLQLHLSELFYNKLRLFTGGFLTLLGMDCFEHLCYKFHLGFRYNAEYIAVEMNDTSLVFGVGKHFSHRFQHAETLVLFSHLKKFTQLVLSSFMPSAAPRTSL